MNNSAEKKNPEVFPENITGRSHCHKSLISSSNQQNATHQKTKQKLAITKNAFNIRSRRLRGLFPVVSRRNCCKQRLGEGLDCSLKI